MYKPIISVITVVLNSKTHFEKTILSLFTQSYRYWELIVIDGGSVDGTVEIIHKYADKISYWISEPDKGTYHAMNKGLKHAKGDYVTFLNAGDYYYNNDVLRELFCLDKSYDIIYGDIYVVKDEQKSARYQKALEFSKQSLLSNNTGVVCHQALFVKKDIAPFYDTSYKYKAELNWYFDIIENNRQLEIKHVNLPVVYYTLGGYGYKFFICNLVELCKLIIIRYGVKSFFKYQYPAVIKNKLKYRYPKLFKYTS